MQDSMTQPNFLRKDLTTSCIGFGLRGASKAQAHRALYSSSSTQKFINLQVDFKIDFFDHYSIILHDSVLSVSHSLFFLVLHHLHKPIRIKFIFLIPSLKFYLFITKSLLLLSSVLDWRQYSIKNSTLRKAK